MHFNKSLCILLLFVGSTQFTLAGLLTFEDDSVAGTYIGNGLSISSSFKLLSLLDNSLFSAPLDINSAYIRFDFSDDENDGGFQVDSYSQNRSGWGDWYWVDPFMGSDFVRRTYNNYSITERSNETEQFSATATTLNGSQSSTGNASGYYSQDNYSRNDRDYRQVGSEGYYTALDWTYNSVFGGRYISKTRYSGEGAFERINSYELVEDYDWSRDTSSYFFLTNLLDDISVTGELDYSLSALAGDFLLSKATLYINIDENPTQGTASIAEPGIFATLVFGLLLILLRKKAHFSLN